MANLLVFIGRIAMVWLFGAAFTYAIIRISACLSSSKQRDVMITRCMKIALNCGEDDAKEYMNTVEYEIKHAENKTTYFVTHALIPLLQVWPIVLTIFVMSLFTK